MVMIIVFAGIAIAAMAEHGRIHISQSKLTPGYTAMTPGSYILTENLSFTGSFAAIVVGTNDVTIDLNGYTIYGGTNSQSAIFQDAGVSRTRIRNGTVAHFTRNSGFAVVLLGEGNVVQDIRFRNCRESLWLGSHARVTGVQISGVNAFAGGGFGINAGNGALIQDCRVSGMSFSTGYTGIVAGVSAIISGCSVVSNSANTFYGISAGAHSIVESCMVNGNNGTNVFSGILVQSNSVVNSVTASQNIQGFLGYGVQLFNHGIIAGSKADRNSSFGIVGGAGSMLVDNVASSNGLIGISITSDGFAMRNHVTWNGQAAPGSGGGMVVSGSGNRIEENSAHFNVAGILINGTGNLVVGNLASGNSTNNILVTQTNNHVGFRRTVNSAFSDWNTFGNIQQ